MKSKTTETLNTIFKNNKLNDSGKTIVNEIFMASHVSNTKSKKNSENWILLCILFVLGKHLCHILYYLV
jgi:hypothetical protein